jgi:hypothetical protein
MTEIKRLPTYLPRQTRKEIVAEAITKLVANLMEIGRNGHRSVQPKSSTPSSGRHQA